MPLGEFELIRRYFQRHAAAGGPVALGTGDDCALLLPRSGTALAISSDMLVQGRHFFADVDPNALGHKALAVNLSDLAACGARPLAFTLALSLPEAQEDWLARFAQGLLDLADAHNCPLIGGDTTRGPLNLCITVLGEVPVVDGRSQALLRSGARAGDALWVSGTLGLARLALDALQGQLLLPPPVLAQLRRYLERPTPRVALGQALRGVASAALDLSDGLVGDLGHMLRASQCGATLHTDVATTLIADYARQIWGNPCFVDQLPAPTLLRASLCGGDDYELLFTAPPDAEHAVLAASRATATPVHCIGRIDAEPGLRLLDGAGQPLPDAGAYASYDHFA